MKKIIIKKNFGFLYLIDSFYSKNSIIKTIKIYEDFLNINLTKLGKYYVLKINKKKDPENQYQLKGLILEFLNYLLSIEFETIKKN